jgi:DNA polymerase-1
MSYICESIEELAPVFDRFNFKAFSLDTETSGAKKEDALRYDKLKLDVITLYDGVNEVYIVCNACMIEYIRTYFKSFVNKSSNVIMCHNIVFDMKVLHKYNIDLRDCEWFDSQVAFHLLDENNFNTGLKDLAQTYLGVTVVKYDELISKDLHNKQFIEYAINDAIYTYKLSLLFIPKLVEEGLQPLFRDIEMPFLRALLDIELNGILIDTQKLQQISTDIIQQLKDTEIQIYDLVDIKYALQYDLYGNNIITSDINLNSSDHLANILFNKLGLKSTEKTDTGRLSVGKFTLENLKGKHPVIELLIKHKQLSKLLSSFSYEALKDFIDSDGCIRSNYRDIGTVTGRLSCNNMNLQQLPKEKKEVGVNIREVFIAGQGYKFISADYSGQELRILGEISQDEKLIEAFKSGRDFHQETANQFGVTRSKAKTINFGIAYGKGAFGFSKDFSISEEEAQEILNNYFSTFPKVKEAIEETNKELDKKDYVTNIFGRKRRMNKVTMNSWIGHLKKDYRQAFNFKIQGAAADMIRIASYKSYLLGKSNPQWDLKLVATIHDEVCFVCKEEYVELACKDINKCFEEAVNFSIKMISEVKYGNSYAEAK